MKGNEESRLFYLKNQVRGTSESLAGPRKAPAFRSEILGDTAWQIRRGHGQGEEHSPAQFQEGKGLRREAGETAEGDADESSSTPERNFAELGTEAHQRQTGQQRLLGQFQPDELAQLHQQDNGGTSAAP